jgi:hypothetical protein
MALLCVLFVHGCVDACYMMVDDVMVVCAWFSSTHSQLARQLAKRFNSEQQLSLYNSFLCTAAFSA